MARYRSGHHVASSPGTTTGSDVETNLDTEGGRSTTTRFRLESDTRPVEAEWIREKGGGEKTITVFVHQPTLVPPPAVRRRQPPSIQDARRAAWPFLEGTTGLTVRLWFPQPAWTRLTSRTRSATPKHRPRWHVRDGLLFYFKQPLVLPRGSHADQLAMRRITWGSSASLVSRFYLHFLEVHSAPRSGASSVTHQLLRRPSMEWPL